jgi:hypothetical protein
MERREGGKEEGRKKGRERNRKNDRKRKEEKERLRCVGGKGGQIKERNRIEGNKERE